MHKFYMGNVVHTEFGIIGLSVFSSFIGLQTDSGVLFEIHLSYFWDLRRVPTAWSVVFYLCCTDLISRASIVCAA